MNKLIERLRRDDRGFSMVVTIGAMALIMASAAASVSVVASDQPIAREDLDRKRSFVAAESALQIYVRRLLDNNDYWRKCQDLPGAVNTPWNGTGADPRTWATLPTGEGRYTFEALPHGTAACNTSTEDLAKSTMLHPDDYTYRVRVTGQAIGATGNPAGPQRALIATFSRQGFLDYAYLTDLETQDPITYPSDIADGQPTRRLPLTNPRQSIADWGQEVCGQYAYVNNRRSQSFEGQIYRRGRLARVIEFGGRKWRRTIGDFGCAEMSFTTNDKIEGPLHLNDQPLICGQPAFGRNPSDRIEVSAPDRQPGSFTQSYARAENHRDVNATGCSNSEPKVNREGASTVDQNLGTWYYNQPRLQLPSSNKKLDAIAGLKFLGETKLELNGTKIKIIQGKGLNLASLNGQEVDFPANGVVYVRNDRCPGISQVGDPQRPRPRCGTVWIKGNYSKALTIAAEDDVRINGPIINAAPNDPKSVLGVIANNFVRVHHPIASRANWSSSRPSNAAEGQRLCRAGNVDNTVNILPGNALDSNGGSIVASDANPYKIQGAFLALNHSFLVDNWKCGNQFLGRIEVTGAVSQRHRGPTRMRSNPPSFWDWLFNMEWWFNWSIDRSRVHGYNITFKYQNSLKLNNPPHFLDPIDAGWRVKTYQEQVPAPGVRQAMGQ